MHQSNVFEEFNICAVKVKKVKKVISNFIRNSNSQLTFRHSSDYFDYNSGRLPLGISTAREAIVTEGF
jgi:hypothetical protein